MSTRTRAFALAIVAVLILTLTRGALTVTASNRLGAPLGRLTVGTVASGVQSDAENVELAGQIGGASYAVAAQGDYAYVGVGPRLVVLDVSDPSSVAVVGRTDALPDIVMGVAVSGDYAYVGDGYSGGLRVIDVSTPSNPTEVASLDAPQEARGVTVAGDHVYVADWTGLKVVDVSTPSAPTLVGRLDTPGSAYAVAVSDTYAYVTDHEEGIIVMDVSTPSSPTKVGSWDTPLDATGVAVSGDYLYVAARSSGGLQVVDVSTPSNPTKVGSLDTPGDPRDVFVAGNYAYVANDYAGVLVVDISVPSSPTEIGHSHTPDGSRPPRPTSVVVYESTVYLADRYGGLLVVNASTPSSPSEVGFYDALGPARGVATSGDHVYVDEAYGLHVVDVSMRSKPLVVGVSRGTCGDPAVARNYAYSACGAFHVVDISTPSDPVEVGHCDLASGADDVALEGDYAYVVDGDGLRVIDVTTPSSPTQVGSLDMPWDTVGVAVAGGHAYVAAGPVWDGSQWVGGGLRVVDVSAPSKPTELGSLETPGRAQDVVVAGEYAYVAGGSEGGLLVVDVSAPDSPVQVGFHDTPGNARSVALAGRYAYVADSYDGLRVVDVGTPSTPSEVGYFDGPSSALDVAASQGYVFVAASGGGLFILRLPWVSASIPASGGSLTSHDGRTTLSFPAESVSDTVAITYTPLESAPTGNLAGIDPFFELTATYVGSGDDAELIPGASYTATITYGASGPAIEDTLGLYWWDDELKQWTQEGITSTVNTTDNVITGQIDHLSVFAVLGETNRVYIPLTLRNIR